MLAKFKDRWPDAPIEAELWANAMASVPLDEARQVARVVLDRADCPTVAEFNAARRGDVESKQARIRELREQLRQAKGA